MLLTKSKARVIAEWIETHVPEGEAMPFAVEEVLTSLTMIARGSARENITVFTGASTT